MSTSTLYTMGMALDRAAENGFEVELLVEGHWLKGHVGANDGVGVVLEASDGHHAVVRTERISAVKINAESPYRTSLPGSHSSWGEATPMPGPRAAYA